MSGSLQAACGPALRVVEPGLATTVQDTGRWGYQRYGIPVSGVLDRESMALANALVGAPQDQAVLEMRYMGPTLEAEGAPVRIAMAGAEIAALVIRSEAPSDRTPETVPAGQTVTLAPGDRIRIGAFRGSTTAMLAVSAPLAIEPVMGSLSTYAKGGFGGLAGAPLVAGDRLALKARGEASGSERVLGQPQDLATPRQIRVVLGPQDDHFTEGAVAAFLSAEWTVSREADRMGLRLEGPELEHRGGFNIASDGIAPGAIQVPGSRLPIILLADRQTTGGYPKIATVISADLPALGRIGPGGRFRFVAVEPQEAVALARKAAVLLKQRTDGIVPFVPGPAPGQIDLKALYESNLISGAVGFE